MTYVLVVAAVLGDAERRDEAGGAELGQQGGEFGAIWDTLAIAETLAERHPDRGLWPADPAARALARTLAAEMHSGFVYMRPVRTVTGRPKRANISQPRSDQLE